MKYLILHGLLVCSNLGWASEIAIYNLSAATRLLGCSLDVKYFANPEYDIHLKFNLSPAGSASPKFDINNEINDAGSYVLFNSLRLACQDVITGRQHEITLSPSMGSRFLTVMAGGEERFWPPSREFDTRFIITDNLPEYCEPGQLVLRYKARLHSLHNYPYSEGLEMRAF